LYKELQCLIRLFNVFTRQITFVKPDSAQFFANPGDNFVVDKVWTKYHAEKNRSCKRMIPMIGLTGEESRTAGVFFGHLFCGDFPGRRRNPLSPFMD
jgi:hypothetical protein